MDNFQLYGKLLQMLNSMKILFFYIDISYLNTCHVFFWLNTHARKVDVSFNCIFHKLSPQLKWYSFEIYYKIRGIIHCYHSNEKKDEVICIELGMIKCFKLNFCRLFNERLLILQLIYFWKWVYDNTLKKIK